jgi:hypothetical protein
MWGSSVSTWSQIETGAAQETVVEIREVAQETVVEIREVVQETATAQDILAETVAQEIIAMFQVRELH